MAVCAKGSVLVFYAVFAVFCFFNFLGKLKKKNASGRFSGAGMDDHQLIFFIWPYPNSLVPIKMCANCETCGLLNHCKY